QIPIAFLTPDEFIAHKQQVLNTVLQQLPTQQNQENLIYHLIEKTNLINICDSQDQMRLLSDISLFNVIVIDNTSAIKKESFIQQKGVQEWAMTMRALGKSVVFIDDAENDDMPIDGKYTVFLDTVISLKPSQDSIAGSRVDMYSHHPCFNVHFEKVYCLSGQVAHPFRAELIVRGNGSHHWVASDITH
ncbi:MAG: polymerase subunit sigma-70, partial [Gammaproteobacteria bacterium]|nr:polymerase subunit sigma-70 [Gammaproteobacteria bacterium]